MDTIGNRNSSKEQTPYLDEAEQIISPRRTKPGDTNSVALNQDSRPAHRQTPLMCKVCLDDREAFSSLCHKYISTLESFFQHKTRDFQAAEDLTQDVFHQVWQNRRNYRPETPDLPYLMGFARIFLKKHYSRRFSRLHNQIDEAVELDYVADARVNSPLELSQTKEQIQVLQGFIERLPKKQRLAVEMIYLKGLSSTIAAKRSTCTEHTIRQNCRFGIRKLLDWFKA